MKRVLVVIHEDTGDADWFSDSPDVDVAIVWNSSPIEAIPEEFRPLAEISGFETEDQSECCEYEPDTHPAIDTKRERDHA